MSADHTDPGAAPEERLDLVARRLNTAVIGDVLDRLGRVHQFLPSGIRPLVPTMVLAGRALPVAVADVSGPQKRPFGLLTEALDALRPGHVYLSNRGRTPCAGWGEILTAAAQVRGAVGAVIEGYHRDTAKVLEQGFPVFSRGAYGQDSGIRAAVIDYGTRVRIGVVDVHESDLVVGDRDGVVVVPGEVEDEVIERALEKASAENTVRIAIEGGMSATEAFATYGVL